MSDFAGMVFCCSMAQLSSKTLLQAAGEDFLSIFICLPSFLKTCFLGSGASLALKHLYRWFFLLRYSSGLLKSHIQLPADADRDQSQLSEVFQQGLAIPYQQDPSVGLGMSSALQRSQLMCGPREPTKHFGISSGGSHSSGECRVSVVGSGCSARPEREGNAAALVPVAAPSAAPGSWHGRSCSTRMGLLGLGGLCVCRSGSRAVTPGRLNYYHRAGRRVKTMGGCFPGSHRKTRAAPAHECARLPIPKQDAGAWGLTPISGHFLAWGCSAGGLKPASCSELIPALFLLWPAPPVPCPARGA
ncbi:uncharacterized protein WM294_007314 [Sarcoramphus papa]